MLIIWIEESEDWLNKYNQEWVVVLQEEEMIHLELSLEEDTKETEKSKSNQTMVSRTWKILLLSDRTKYAMKHRMRILYTHLLNN